MPDWYPKLLLFVFATHMPFFAWRWLRSGEPRHAATTLTFALLSLTYGVRVFAPELEWGEAPLWMRLRVVAWSAAAISIGLLLRHWAMRWRGRRS